MKGVEHSGAFVRVIAWLGATVLLGLTIMTFAFPDPSRIGEVDDEDWPTFGRAGDEQHYSPLDQINLSTVVRLGLTWQYELPADHTVSGPVAAEGKLFVTTGHSFIRAFDGASGKLLWEFDSRARSRRANAAAELCGQGHRLLAWTCLPGDDGWSHHRS